MSFPLDLLYSAEHEWVRAGATLRVGITSHAAAALGDIIYMEIPSAGDTVEAGEPCGEAESTKAVSDIYAPVSGVVTAVNIALKDSPSWVNDDPYGEGWIFEVRPTAGDWRSELMDADTYARLVKG